MCQSNELRCTEMCKCTGDPDHCDNTGESEEDNDEDLCLSEIGIDSDIDCI